MPDIAPTGALRSPAIAKIIFRIRFPRPISDSYKGQFVICPLRDALLRLKRSANAKAKKNSANLSKVT